MMRPSVLMVGTGEYTTGYVHNGASGSDKSAGVVALSLFDMRRRGMVGRLMMAGTNGSKFPGIRRHVHESIARVYKDLDVSFESFPDDTVRSDPQAYLAAMDELQPGDIVTLFTPDDTHFAIAMEAVDRSLHVLVAKPIVKTLEEHLTLAEAARRNGVLVAMEVHKRWDPIYADARDRIRQLGDFSFFSSFMSQPKSQLQTFRSWAGKSSDISYYLNAHHIDFNVWSVAHIARPLAVTALASTGVAKKQGVDAEDTITLGVQWENIDSGSLASAFYTASWIAPKSDVHSQQRFYYLGQKGEVQIDQAHRGYTLATDAAGFSSPNPLFMKYTPDAQGYFSGQSGYGYRSIEAFVDAVAQVRAGLASPQDFRGGLATVDDTVLVTAILEAGRRSLDSGGLPHQIEYAATGDAVALSVA
ncbi:MAG: Gfo/Idh/MocA family oxidoreductase [Pirellulales bacterium]